MDIPILIEINPGRLGLPDSEDSLKRAKTDINTWIQQGLVATIKSQNFLLGSQLVDLSYDDESTQGDLNYFKELAVIPTGQDTLAKFTDSIEELLAKVNQLPVESIMNKMEALLDEGASTLAGVQELVKSADSLVESDRNAELIEQLSATLGSLEDLASSFSGDSQANRDLQRLLQNTSNLLEELTPLISQLKNQPNGLLFPSRPPEDIQPQRKQP
jgi:paraquat-inducible protein B